MAPSAHPKPDLATYAHRVCQFLDQEAIPYAFTGGMALAFWGYPRSTIDVDLIIMTDQPAQALWKSVAGTPFMMEPDELIFPHMKVFRGLITTPSSELIMTDLLQVDASWSRDILRRRVSATLLGKNIWISSPEDIILLKLFSQREKDKDDIRMLLQIRKELMDRQYITDWSSRLGSLDQWNEINKS